jgi:hypothetical protein
MRTGTAPLVQPSSTRIAAIDGESGASASSIHAAALDIKSTLARCLATAVSWFFCTGFAI